MTEEINLILSEFKSANDKSLEHLKSELQKIRASRATPSLLDSVKVDYYGSETPLSQVANVTTIDARTISVQPWEKSMLDEISRGIVNANIGLSPQNNGEMIMINVPALTEERRKEFVKKAKAEGEASKVVIRNNRKDANDMVKDLKAEGLPEDMGKDAEAEIQTITNQYSDKIDQIIKIKEEDIMKV